MDGKEIAIRSVQIMSTGTRPDFDSVIHPECINRESVTEPPECRVPGPAGWYAAAQWLRAAFGNFHHNFDYAVAEAGLVCVRATMRARHVGPFVLYTPEGDVDEAFPPTGKEFVVTQTHWLRLEDSKVIEHWANRDDLAMAKQAGWVPPTSVYLLKMALARRRAKHELAASLKNMPPG